MARGAYARAGVDVEKLRGIQGAMASALEGTFSLRRAGQTGAPLMRIGHYSGMVDLGDGRALTLHTDGVGTKVLVAQAMEKYDTVGIDCVAMTVNDLVCLASEPVALLDYIALEREDDDLVAEIAKGLAEGAKQARTPIVGGETAILGEMVKGVGGRGFDLVSMGVGTVAKGEEVDGSEIAVGDSVIGLKSSGLHSNGYTLARKVLAKHPLDLLVPELGRTLGEELLVPTRIYVEPALRLSRKMEVHGLAHVTGGAFTKLTRLVGDRALSFRLEPFAEGPIFAMIAEEGRIPGSEMYSTFNMGVGFCVVLPAALVEDALKLCRRLGFPASVIGTVARGKGVYVGRRKIA